MEDLRRAFRPEFLNRVDDVVLFKPLTIEEIERIVELQLRDFHARVEQRGLKLAIGDAARKLVAREGFDPVYGARPLKRFIQREIESPVARRIVAGDLAGGTVKIGAKGGRLTIE
jgi:ATP-dependent Clp protease ATP-binding subunit ClpB